LKAVKTISPGNDLSPKVEAYNEFLITKIKVAEKHGIKIDPSRLHQSTKPHQTKIITWGLELGAALIAPDCGTGKTHIGIETSRILLEEFGGKALIVTELGASETFINPDPAVGEGARLGIALEYVTNQEEAMKSSCNILVTNYERVRMGNFDFAGFTVVWLDEGNYIKNMASETTEALGKQLKRVKYKYIASATPSPNETLELVNYAHVLGIADRGQILTQFFQRNSTKAGELTLHPQHVEDFWLWVHSWMVAIEFPSDLGFSDEGYKLPELRVHWIEVPMGKAFEAGTEKNGQKKMFLDTGNSLPDNSKVKQQSIDVRVKKAMEIIGDSPDDHFILWHHLNNEKAAIDKKFKGKDYASLYGALKESLREKIVVDFTKGDLKYLATNPEISGVGCNFQRYCHKAILVGVDNDFNLLYQMIKRIHRFGQGFPVDFYILYLPEEYSIVQNVKRKWKQHTEQRTWLRGLVQKYGLDHTKMIEERKRTFKSDRKVYEGKNYTLVSDDCVRKWFELEDNSIDFSNSSFPFGNHYEYTNYYNDFGHNISNQAFSKQLDFFLPEYFRTLKPGRIVTVHLKNRIHYGSVTGLGFSVFHRFTHLVCDAMEKHGFYTMGFHYVPTCVVGENNQTYRLTFGEMQKDSTKMGAGIPEEIWVFRKPPTTTADAYADEPVKHNHAKCQFCGHTDLQKEFAIKGSFLFSCPGCKQYLAEGELIVCDQPYTLSQWQIDADAFWMSSGNRYISPNELKRWDLSKIRKWWDQFNPSVIYDYEKHIELLQQLDGAGKLSRTFTTLPLVSGSDYIWNNVNRMHGLNLEQSRRKERNHICPQPYDEVDRVIELYSNPGDLVADPFTGIGTTLLRALKKGRKAFGTELNTEYARHADFYLRKEENKIVIPTLFDLATLETKIA
jgi:hypothetical protein